MNKMQIQIKKSNKQFLASKTSVERLVIACQVISNATTDKLQDELSAEIVNHQLHGKRSDEVSLIEAISNVWLIQSSI